MTISRAQMKRQLYAGGGIATLAPREKFGFGSSLKKFVRNIIPNEVSEVAVKAAPFVAMFNPAVGAAMAGLGSFDQTGRIGSSLKSAAITYGVGQLGQKMGTGQFQGNPFTSGGAFSPSGFKAGFQNPFANLMGGAKTTGTDQAFLTGSDVGGNITLGESKYGANVIFQDAGKEVAKKGFFETLQKSTGEIFNRGVQSVLNTSPDTLIKAGITFASLASGLLAKKEGESESEYKERVNQVGPYLRQYYSKLNPNKSPAEVDEFVNSQLVEYGVDTSSTFAEGGRVGFQEGGISSMYQNYLKDIQNSLLSNPTYYPTVSYETTQGDADTPMPNNISRGSTFNPTKKDLALAFFNPALGIANIASRSRTGLSIAQRLADAFNIDRGIGGRTRGYGIEDSNAIGSTTAEAQDPSNMASENPEAMGSSTSGPGEATTSAGSAADPGTAGDPFAEGGRVMKEMGGIMDIPTGDLRQNQQGVQELDYRQEGGFVPVGVKEKADDVPAMLSKNEFVMTADAVRGMGNGSIENGAQKMYNLMKSLENRMA